MICESDAGIAAALIRTNPSYEQCNLCVIIMRGQVSSAPHINKSNCFLGCRHTQKVKINLKDTTFNGQFSCESTRIGLFGESFSKKHKIVGQWGKGMGCAREPQGHLFSAAQPFFIYCHLQSLCVDRLVFVGSGSVKRR